MGETWAATKKQLPNCNLTVVDFCAGMLRYAKKKSRAKFDNSIVVLQQDILNNTLPNNHYDFVTCAFGLKTFNPEQLLILATETKRILKEGGQFSFIEISKPKNKVLRLFYGFYLGHIIPILGSLFLGNPKEYKMLWKYTSKFNDAQSTQNIFSRIGLNPKFDSYFFGCATGFSGTKLGN